MFDNTKIIIGIAIIVVLAFGYYYYTRPERKTEKFTYDQIALNAKNYTFIPSKQCQGCLPSSPRFCCNDLQ